MKKRHTKPLSILLSVAVVLGTFITFPGVPAQAAAVDHVVINEVYGGGGNSGAIYQNDFIELYNPTDNPVDLNGWSVQYGSATSVGNFSGVITLSGTIAAKGYFLVQGASTAAVGAALPTPAASSTINLSGTSAITAGSASALSTVSGLVDFVGFGTTANAYEGSGAAPAPSNTTSVVRKTAGADTDDNAQDFTTQKPDPQNSASASAPVDSGKNDTITFTPAVTPDANGYVPSETAVALSCANGGEIYYKLNGGTDTAYTAPIVINQTTTIAAWTVKDSSAGSIQTVTYQVDTKVVAVTATPGTNYNSKVGDKVSLSCATPGASIYYSLDPAAADSTYLPYSGPITLAALPTTITAYAKIAEMTDSDKAVFKYQAPFTGTYHTYFG